MLIAFTDESYSSEMYFQGAFVIDSELLENLNQLILEASEYARGFGVEPGTEFHGHSIMSATKGWEPLGRNFHMKKAIYSHVLRRISNSGGTLIIEGVDITRLNQRYKYPRSPHEITHKGLLDKLDRFAESKGETIQIYSDSVNSEMRLAQLFTLYQIHSTSGLYPRYLKSIIQVQHVDSHLHSGIQIADLCIYLFRRFRDHNESQERTKRDVESMWNILTPTIDSNFQPRIWSP
jgi:hypothetical protein